MQSVYMFGEYHAPLVALSLLVATLASFTAFDVVSRMGARESWRAYGWLLAGALALGTGVWATHFVAMIAFELPVSISYDLPLILCSWAIAVLTSGVALNASTRAGSPRRRVVVGALALTVGIASMHYTGMEAMHVQPRSEYHFDIIAVSIAASFVACLVALWMASFLRRPRARGGFARKIGASLILAGGIAAVHYIGMAATRFSVGSAFGTPSALDSVLLATLVGASTLVFLGIALVVSIQDRRIESETAELVASLSQANAELLHRSRHDALTGLPNRSMLNERIDKRLERWKTTGAGFTVAYIDLDGFKAINDHLGHRAGDVLLNRIAELLRQSLTPQDMVARMGGDEFVVLMDSVDDVRAASAVCGRILSAITAVEYQGVELAASVGYAVCPNDGAEAEMLVAAADMAMYRGKLAGKNRVQRYREDMGARMSDDFALQGELREAIRGDGLAVYFQPRFHTRERTLMGAEALVRWPHPVRGFISPERFIGIAERCGLITELEIRVLDLVGGHIRSWLDAGLHVPPISVNLSAVRIRDEALPDHVQACLDKYSLDPGYISFEITESLAVREIVQARSALGMFKHMGIEVALDDFGTGYSSLFYLKQLPIQQIKIDRGFIADLPDVSESKAEIVEWIIRLSHELGLKVVAEGVETETQLHYLQQIGCDEVQGFLLSRPLPAEGFRQLLIPQGA
ncbi:EAL domain-containing protein [Salinisphaera sp. T5B8]|uniref:putative bifunctional diguanylate cyclase/phosphodiesterase n=1 Tax=Salinisphaera sp. T5B8 TaxID=1304154 RepID=UPI00333F9436